MVAIEFAASCRPLSKSNVSAKTIRAIRTGRLSTASMVKTPSELVYYECVDLVRDVFEPVDHRLQMIVNLGANDVVHDIALRLLACKEQLLAALIVNLVRLLFDLDDLFDERR